MANQSECCHRTQTPSYSQAPVRGPIFKISIYPARIVSYQPANSHKLAVKAGPYASLQSAGASTDTLSWPSSAQSTSLGNPLYPCCSSIFFVGDRFWMPLYGAHRHRSHLKRRPGFPPVSWSFISGVSVHCPARQARLASTRDLASWQPCPDLTREYTGLSCSEPSIYSVCGGQET